MSTVNDIYELIKKDNSANTFINNKELFLDFYYNNMDLVYGEPHVMDIFKYILSLKLEDENEEFPYINSKIFGAFNRYEQDITQNVYLKKEFDDSYIDKIFKLIDDYYEISESKDSAVLHHLYTEEKFIRDTTGSMMVLLNKSFFNISNDNISKMMNFIRNNKYLQSIINSGESNRELLDKEYIYDYASRFLFNVYFLNDDNIENDPLLKALKEGRIKDKQLFKDIMNNTDNSFLLMAFNDLSNILDSIENTFEDELERKSISRKIIDRMLEDRDYDVLADFIMHDTRNEQYIDSQNKENILLLYPYSTGKGLTKEEVNYYLDNNLEDIVLLNNLKEELLHNDWDEETRKRVEKATENIEYYDLNTEQALKVLDVLFTKEKGINYPIMIAAIRRLIKDYVNDDSINVYFSYKNKDNVGTTYQDENTIVLNVSHVADLLKAKNIDSNPEVLDILVATFHEARHIVQFKDGDLDENLYKQHKEELLTRINMGYYRKNYYGVSFEKDARIHGAKGLVELLKTNYPYMTNAIEYYTNIMQKEMNEEEVVEKELFELSDKVSVDDALEKVISINKDLVKHFPFLRKEYDEDGKRQNEKELDIMLHTEETPIDSKKRNI